MRRTAAFFLFVFFSLFLSFSFLFLSRLGAEMVLHVVDVIFH